MRRMIRRHAATVNAEWGNETAVLLGDYLFTHAFHLAASLESTRACRWIGHATNRVCEGEMQQVHHRGNLDLDESEYFAIIEGKTAELTAVSCRLGASYAGAPESTVAALDRYGRNLGIAFQIADDVLDIWGEERVTGKSLGTDLEKQKLTLPVIRLLRLAEPAAAATIRAHCSPRPTREARRRLRPYLEQTGALDYAWQRAKQSRQAGRRRPRLPGGFRRQVGAAHPGPIRRPPPILTAVARPIGIGEAFSGHYTLVQGAHLSEARGWYRSPATAALTFFDSELNLAADPLSCSIVDQRSTLRLRPAIDAVTVCNHVSGRSDS